MSLREQLTSDLQDAIRQRDEVRKTALRLLMSAVSNAEIAAVDVKDPDARRSEFDDQAVMAIIAKQAKQRRESIDEFAKAGRQDLVDKETAELRVLEAYLPPAMSRDDIVDEARKVIAELGARGASDKGRVMPVLIQRLAGKAEGRAINEVVTELLTSAS